MTDISIIGTGCLIVALVIAAGIVIWQRREIGRLSRAYSVAVHVIEELDDEIFRLEEAEAKLQAQRIAAAKKGREAQAAAKVAKKAAGQ